MLLFVVTVKKGAKAHFCCGGDVVVTVVSTNPCGVEESLRILHYQSIFNHYVTLLVTISNH